MTTENTNRNTTKKKVIVGFSILTILLVVMAIWAINLSTQINCTDQVATEQVVIEPQGDDVNHQMAEQLTAAMARIGELEQKLNLDYDHSLREDGQPVCTDWLVRSHPLGEVAFPAIRDEKGILLYRGDRPPHVECLPECWPDNTRWLHVMLGEEVDGEFHYFAGLDRIYRPGVKSVWALVKNQDWDSIPPAYMAKVVVVQKKASSGS